MFSHLENVGGETRQGVLHPQLPMLQAPQRPNARHRVLRQTHQTHRKLGSQRVSLPSQGHRQLRHRRTDLRAEKYLRGPRGNAHIARRNRGDGRVLQRRHRQAPRQLQSLPLRDRRPRRQHLHARRRPLPLLAHHQPLQAPPRRQGLQPHRHGLQRQPHLHGHCQKHLQDAAQQARLAHHLRVPQPQLVHRQRQIHDPRQLPLPLRRLRDSLDQQTLSEGQSHAKVEVPGEDPPRCQRRGLWLLCSARR